MIDKKGKKEQKSGTDFCQNPASAVCNAAARQVESRAFRRGCGRIRGSRGQ
jgi:hypothetical protein